MPLKIKKLKIVTIIEKFVFVNNISLIKKMGKMMGHLNSNQAEDIDIGLAGSITKDFLGK